MNVLVLLLLFLDYERLEVNWCVKKLQTFPFWDVDYITEGSGWSF